MLRTRIKRIGGEDSGEDSNKGFSYIISSWLMEEGEERTAIMLYITASCPTSSKKYIQCFCSGGLGQHFVGIAISRCFGGAC